VARRIWFDRLYLAEQLEDEDINAHWDKLVILAQDPSLRDTGTSLSRNACGRKDSGGSGGSGGKKE
jgi:hypothetical protein